MKKLLSIILTLLIVMSVCACSNTESTTWTTNNEGNGVLSSKGRTTVFPEELPADILYNASCITATDVTAYQLLTSDYSYCLYLVIKIDVSELDEAQIHWLRKSDIDVLAYLTNEKNGYDFDQMTSLGNLLDTGTNTIYYVKSSSFFKENRYDFSDSEITLSIDVKQEETYEYTSKEGTKSDLNMHESIHYTFNVESDLPDAEEIPQHLYQYIVEWIADYNKLFE